jgi:hypothetical protein
VNPAVKSAARLAARALMNHRLDERGLGVSLASSPWLPWWIRERLAQLEMLARSDIDLGIRASFLPEARFVKEYPMPDSLRFGPIWQYWNSGADRCPPIVRDCVASVRRHAGNRDIIFLNDDNVRDYATLPTHVWQKRELIGATKFANVLRVSLLAQHGGTWIDTTILLTGGIKEFTPDVPFFTFTQPNDPKHVTNSFIHSAAGHPLVCMMRDLQTAYWLKYDKTREYYMYHFLFESAITLHADLRAIWQKTPIVFLEPTHLLQKALLSGSNFERLQEICRRTPLHKLSYKFPKPVMRQAERVAASTAGALG